MINLRSLMCTDTLDINYKNQLVIRFSRNILENNELLQSGYK